MKNNIKILFTFVIILNFIGCSFSEFDPFVFGNVKALIVDKENNTDEFFICNYAYYTFDFYNLSNKTIKEIEINYILQLDNTKRKIAEVIYYELKPNEKINFKFNLDIYLTKIPKTIAIENFAIKKIKYIDGSIWKNNFF